MGWNEEKPRASQPRNIQLKKGLLNVQVNISLALSKIGFSEKNRISE